MVIFCPFFFTFFFSIPSVQIFGFPKDVQTPYLLIIYTEVYIVYLLSILG